MGKSAALQSQLLKLLFNGTPIPNLADNAAISPLTVLYVSLHTADPTAAGSQSSFEATYPGYARVAAARTTAAWTVSGSGPTKVAPVANILWPTATGGSETETFWGVGISPSGANALLYSGAISPTIPVANLTTPELTTASAITES